MTLQTINNELNVSNKVNSYRYHLIVLQRENAVIEFDIKQLQNSSCGWRWTD